MENNFRMIGDQTERYLFLQESQKYTRHHSLVRRSIKRYSEKIIPHFLSRFFALISTRIPFDDWDEHQSHHKHEDKKEGLRSRYVTGLLAQTNQPPGNSLDMFLHPSFWLGARITICRCHSEQAVEYPIPKRAVL